MVEDIAQRDSTGLGPQPFRPFRSALWKYLNPLQMIVSCILSSVYEAT